jgi:hypothetical protein
VLPRTYVEQEDVWCDKRERPSRSFQRSLSNASQRSPRRASQALQIQQQSIATLNANTNANANAIGNSNVNVNGNANANANANVNNNGNGNVNGNGQTDAVNGSTGKRAAAGAAVGSASPVKRCKRS